MSQKFDDFDTQIQSDEIETGWSAEEMAEMDLLQQEYEPSMDEVRNEFYDGESESEYPF